MMSEGLHVHLDAVGGAAGDMFVAALIDAFPELRSRVLADLAAVMPACAGTPRLEEGVSGGISALRFALVADHDHPHDHPHDHGHDHPHDHAHDHHDHGHDHHHDHAHDHHDHGHTHSHPDADAAPVRFPEIAARISAAALSPGTAAEAIAILRRLAEAESRMHRVPVDEVHFHEIADWDSLMDVVAAGSIAAALAGATWSVSELPLGGGTIRAAHGRLPVPAPATAEILKGFLWRDDGVFGERVTPTGGAILAHLAPAGGVRRCGALKAVGCGAGSRDLPGVPNILRALVFAPGAAAPGTGDAVTVLGFDVDDMSGEEIGVAAERLRALSGVLDVSLGARVGKKGRPLTDFRILARPEAFEDVCEACFRETSTIGLRWRSEERRVLARAAESAMVEGVALRRKRSERPGGASVKVESDDLAGLGSLAQRRKAARLAEEG